MRRLLACIFVWVAGQLFAGPTPPELAAALKDFRTEGPRGWAFTQTSVAGERSLAEHFDPIKPDFKRWTLLTKNGAPPTADELKDYSEKQTRRTGGLNAPNVKDQLAPDSCETLSETAEVGVYRFRLKPGADDDKSAAFMATTFTLHRPTATITRVELASLEPFSPMMTVKIQEARTVMTYSVPTAERPTLLQNVTLRIRGRAMWFKSLDQDMLITYSDHTYAGKK
jgi:hypothetical protein